MMESHKDSAKPTIVTGIHYIVPNVICKLLASASIIINLWWARNQEVQLIGMGVASLFSQTFGYLLVITLNLGLGYEIGRKRGDTEQVGIFYQRALFMNFVVCAFAITPLLYLSKTIVKIFSHVDQALANMIGEYLFQLVPSIYCFVYFDTTQTFLLAQYKFLAPLVINIVAVFCHYHLIRVIGAAWSKNFTDLGCSIALYIFLATQKNNIKSYIEWNIQCIKNWSIHLKFIKNIGLSTYLQALFFLLYSLMGYNLPRQELICHICFLNISQIYITVIIGLKQGMLIKVADAIKKKLLKNYRQEGEISLKMFSIITILILLLMLIYVKEIAIFFMNSQKAQKQFLRKCWVLFLSLLIDSINISIGSLLKSLDKNYTALKIQAFFYSLAIGVGLILCYGEGMGFLGLWIGWIIGNSLGCLVMALMLIRAQKNFIQFIELKKEKQKQGIQLQQMKEKRIMSQQYKQL